MNVFDKKRNLRLKPRKFKMLNIKVIIIIIYLYYK